MHISTILLAITLSHAANAEIQNITNTTSQSTTRASTPKPQIRNASPRRNQKGTTQTQANVITVTRTPTFLDHKNSNAPHVAKNESDAITAPPPKHYTQQQNNANAASRRGKSPVRDGSISTATSECKKTPNTNSERSDVFLYQVFEDTASQGRNPVRQGSASTATGEGKNAPNTNSGRSDVFRYLSSEQTEQPAKDNLVQMDKLTGMTSPGTI